MKILIKRLTTLLDEETELLGALLSILQDENNALICAKLNKLNETCKKKENLILKIRILEEQRIHVLQEFSELSGHTPGIITLAELSGLAEGDDYTRLAGCRSNLLSLSESIRDLNKSNRSLLNYSIGLVRTSLSFLDNFISPNLLYYNNGRLQTIHQTGRLHQNLA
jgi:flagellar biosynthesis/type III secretory pathway chaperone